MEDIIKEAAGCFNITLRSYSKSKAAFLLDADCGQLILKKQGDIRKIEEQYQLSEALYSAGFTNAERYMTVGGRPYISLSDGVYTLLSCRGGKCNFADYDNTAAVAKAVARLHNTGKSVNIKSIESSKAISRLYYDKRLAEARHIKKWLDKRSHLTDIDVLFIKKYGLYMEIAAESSKIICEHLNALPPALCFGDFKEDCVFIDDDKNVTLMNLENCVLSAPETDLCRLMVRFLKRGGSMEQLHHIISSYECVRELSARDSEFFKAYISFPHKFFALINKYYNGRKPCGSLHRFAKLKSEAACYEKMLAALKII